MSGHTKWSVLKARTQARWTLEEVMRAKFDALVQMEELFPHCGELATPYPLPYGTCHLDEGHEGDHRAYLGWPYHRHQVFEWPQAVA